MCGSVADSGMKCDSDGEMVGEMSWLSCFQLSLFFQRCRVAGLRCNGVSWRARTACEGAPRGMLLPRRCGLVAACGCWLALLLPLTTLLGVLAAVLLPSFLRCVQLKHLHGLLRARGAAPGVRATCAILLLGNRKPC